LIDQGVVECFETNSDFACHVLSSVICYLSSDN